MSFKKSIRIAFVAVSIVCLSPQQLSAGTFGNYTYTDKGSSITIDSYQANFIGSITVPAVIDGKPVTEIGEHAFELETWIQGITIPSSVTTIRAYAFALCRSLRSVTIPSSVTFIGEHAFDFCDSLENITIPLGVTTISNGTFLSCSRLQNVGIHKRVTSIGDGAFGRCRRLERFKIPTSVTQIGSAAFHGCDTLKTLVIPPSVKTVGDYAFSNSGLVNIKLPPTVTVIGKGAFAGCRALKSVKLPPNITELGDRLFADCSRLTPPAIPQKVVRIGAKAFTNCNLPYTMVIPASVRQIGNKAFTSKGNLKSAVFTGKAPKMGNHVFDGAAPGFKIFIPEGKSGYTVPKWFGYRSSMSSAEIEVLAENKKSVINGNVVTKFSDVIVGESSMIKRFTILNVGSRYLTGIYAVTDGDSAADFIVNPLTKSSLAPGKSTTIEIKFLPMKSGNRHAQLRIMSNDRNENPFIINLKGTGLRLAN